MGEIRIIRRLHKVDSLDEEYNDIVANIYHLLQNAILLYEKAESKTRNNK